MPDLGEGVTEGEINKWLIKEGDTVQEDQIVLEVMTDKATVEIPTFHSGKVTKIIAKEGDTVPVGQTLAHIGEGSIAKETKSEPAPKVAPQVATPTPTAAPKSTSFIPSASDLLSVQAAPVVRRQAQERGLDLLSISGSGPKGRILLSDLESAKAIPTKEKPTERKKCWRRKTYSPSWLKKTNCKAHD